MTGGPNNGAPTTGTAPELWPTNTGPQSATVSTSTKPNGPCAKSPTNANVVGSSGRSGGGGSGTAPSTRTSKKRRKAPDIWWTTLDGEKLQRLTWKEWVGCRELLLKGAKLGLHKPGMSQRRGL